MNTTATAPTPTLKERHRAMWASGDYPEVATTLIPDLGQALVEACDLQPGQRVLDVAAGSGNAAIPAALAGAQVTASDLTPELFVAGREEAARAGVDITWEVGDAEALPYDDASFDVVMSCVGVMFAPDHAASANELVRVVRPGGTIGLVSWTPEGFIGQMFSTMKPYAPPPPPGAQPPPLWGREEHVRELLGDAVTDVSAQRRSVVIDRFRTAEEFLDFFKRCYGPTIAVYKFLAEQPDRAASLDQELLGLATRHDRGDGSMEWEYLILTAHRAA
jgi:ubiquinone/menaquinone biosynthesis C-methylase UbiE